MSLFADRWSSSVFDSSPFAIGTDSFPSSSFGRLGLHSDKFLDNRPTEHDSPFSTKMRLRNPTLAERGFYDHFDSIFHDLRPPNHRRQFADFDVSSRRSNSADTKGKEHIIPIKIVNSASTSDSPVAAPSAKRPHNENDETKLNSRTPGSGRMIEIPVSRETSKPSTQEPSLKFHREKSRSPIVSSGNSYKAPSHFTVLTPTTEELNGRKQTRGDDDDVIYLDDSDFFRGSRNSPHQKSLSSSRRDSGLVNEDDTTAKFRDRRHITRIEIKEEDEETKTLRRKPLRQFQQNDAAEKATSSPTECMSGGVKSSPTSCRNDGKDDDVIALSGAEKNSKLSPCCHRAGPTDVTLPPSYPIYDYLKPRLATIGRRVDYIRGDGNCFFRALSKEMYDTEDFHAEWRQAVCDLITKHPNVFSQYIDGGHVTSHVKEMRVPGSWATTCEIYASATLLQRQVYVLAPTPGRESPSSSSEYHWLLFSPRSLSGTHAGSSVSKLNTADCEDSHDDIHPCYLTLCHTNGNHYDRIVPVFARCNCKMPPPALDGVSVLLDLTESEEEEIMEHS